MSASPAIQSATSSTPILDRLAPMPTPRGAGLTQLWIELASAILLLIPFFWRPPFMRLFFGWAGANITLIMTDDGWTGIRMILTGFAMAVVCSGAILIHECGHLLSGLALGFRCKSFRFGRVKIERGFKISRYQDAEDAALGSAAMVPMRWDNLRMRTAAMIMAGPLFNVASVYAMWHLRSNQTLISGVFLAWSTYLGICSLFPFNLYGVAPDGKRLLMLLFQRQHSERYLALLKLSDEIDRGVGPGSLDPEALKRAMCIRDESNETVRAHTIGYLASFTRQHDQETSQLLETALQYSGHSAPALRAGLAVLAAFFQTFVRNRLDLAEQWLAEATGASQFLEMRSAVEKAISKSKADARADVPAPTSSSVVEPATLL